MKRQNHKVSKATPKARSLWCHSGRPRLNGSKLFLVAAVVLLAYMAVPEEGSYSESSPGYVMLKVGRLQAEIEWDGKSHGVRLEWRTQLGTLAK